jgi:hypothetical protein
MLVIKRGESRATGEDEAARELAAQIRNDDAAFALVFASCRYDPAKLSLALTRELLPVPVFGCTSIGEIGANGFGVGGIVGMTMAAPGLRIGVGCVPHISRGALSAGHTAVLDAAQGLGCTPYDLAPNRHVGLCLIDWRSQSEEMFIAGAGATSPSISLVGGSASDHFPFYDDPGFESRLLCHGQAVADCGLILLLETDVPFKLIVSEHMVPRDGRVVVTKTDPASRLVHELDGRPALERYKEVMDITDDVDSQLAGQLPFGYYVEGRPYVRSVMGVEGNSLRFACGVDRGTVLVPMQPGDMIPTTEQALAEAERELGGSMAAFIAFSCYGRFLETERTGLTDAIGDVLTRYPSVGFNTFGEQVHTLHVNHTLTGLAFGGANAT